MGGLSRLLLAREGEMKALGLSLTRLSEPVLARLADSAQAPFIDCRGTSAAASTLDEDGQSGLGRLGCHPLCDYRHSVFRLWLIESFGL